MPFRGFLAHPIFNTEDRLTTVEDGNGAVIAAYYYDPFGRRLWKDAGGARTYFSYSDEGLVGEFDNNGTEIKAYGYRPGSTWTTDPLFMKVGGNYYFYHNDHFGTPQKMTAANGAVVWSATYSSFGEASVDASSTITNNLRFPGQYYDQEIGLHYNYHRYYDPRTGRYLTPDPIGLLGGINLFAYVNNNPVNFIDPEGKLNVIEGVFIGVGAYYTYQFYSKAREATRTGEVIQKLGNKMEIALSNSDFELAGNLDSAIRDLQKKGLSQLMDVIESSPAGTTIGGLPITSIEDLAIDDIARIISDYYASRRKPCENN